MIRLAWRQMRLPAIATSIILAGLAIALVLTNRSMTSSMHTSGLSSCLASNGNCGDLVDSFMNKYVVVTGLVSALSFAPALAGLFWGAPLIAREVEQSTHRLVWSQSITRRRWFTVRIGLYVLGAAAIGGLLTWLLTWWYGPLIDIQPDRFNNIQPGMFDSRGIVLVANMVFAFAVGTAAGAIIRRTVPAMAVTLVGFLGERILFLFERGYLLPPKSITVPFGDLGGTQLTNAWVLHQSLIDGTGKAVTPDAILNLCSGVLINQGKGGMQSCAAQHGFRNILTYQPLSRFWPLQGIESGILIAAAVILLAVAAWWTLRRIS